MLPPASGVISAEYVLASVVVKLPAEPLVTKISPTAKPETSSENSNVTENGLVEFTAVGAF